jgi:hypothetical protein
VLGIPVEDAFAARFFSNQDVDVGGALACEDGVKALRLPEKAERGAGVLYSGKEIEASTRGLQSVKLESDDVVLEALGRAFEANQALTQAAAIIRSARLPFAHLES